MEEGDNAVEPCLPFIIIFRISASVGTGLGAQGTFFPPKEPGRPGGALWVRRGTDSGHRGGEYNNSETSFYRGEE